MKAISSGFVLRLRILLMFQLRRVGESESTTDKFPNRLDRRQPMFSFTARGANLESKKQESAPDTRILRCQMSKGEAMTRSARIRGVVALEKLDG